MRSTQKPACLLYRCYRSAKWPKAFPVFCTKNHAADYGLSEAESYQWCVTCMEWHGPDDFHE